MTVTLNKFEKVYKMLKNDTMVKVEIAADFDTMVKVDIGANSDTMVKVNIVADLDMNNEKN
jgi:hypothetical protein